MDVAALFEIAENVTSSTDLDVVLEKIGAVSRKLLNCEASSIMLLDDAQKVLYFKVATGDKAKSIRKLTVPVGVGVAGWVAENLRSVLIEDVNKDIRFSGSFDKSSGFITRSLMCVPMFSKGEIIGVAEALNKIDNTFTQQDMGLFTHLAGLASVAIINAKLIQDQRNFFSHTLEVLSLGIESLGPPFWGHPWRSQRIAVSLGRRLELSQRELSHLTHASLLHDIGYIAARVPGYIKGLNLSQINSNAKVDSELLHPVLGEGMLSGVEIFKGALPIIRHHHERFDGRGYPDHLKAKNIPIGARILALVEVVENIRFQLRSGTAEEFKVQAKLEVNNLSGSQLDPEVTHAFIEAVGEEENLL